MSDTVICRRPHTDNTIEYGLELATIPESEGGWKEMFESTELADLTMKDDYKRATTAVLLENAKQWQLSYCRAKRRSDGTYRLDETTRSALLGGFSDYLYPIIRASFPTNILSEIATVQATTRRTATILHWNWIVGKGKGGNWPDGTRLFDSQRGVTNAAYDLSSDVVTDEPITALGSAGATDSGILKNADGGGLRPGTVSLTLFCVTAAGNKVFVDNGNGGFIAPAGITIASSAIDYRTGAWSITLTGETFSTAATNVANYRWDTEGSSKIPELDVQIITSTVETERRALKLNYTMEAMFDVLQETGTALEPQLLQGAAEEIAYETARQGIALMWLAAGPAVDTFPKTPPSANYNQQDHFKDLVYKLSIASNRILKNTQKGYGNFLIVDDLAANVIESLPAGMFVAAPRPASVNGPHFIGTLLGKYRVYKDIFLGTLPGASANGNILMGYKGSEFFQAGLAWSPYQLLYTTDTLTTADQVAQKGIASRYAFKMVQPKMYVRIDLGA